MVVLFESGAFRVMCKHIQLIKNTWYYRRRIPLSARHLYGSPTSPKGKEQVYFSLKTSDKAVAAKRADSETRKLDALWKAADVPGSSHANPLIALATIEAAGLRPGDALRYPEHPYIENFVDHLIGQREPDAPQTEISAQDQMTLGVLAGEAVPPTLSDAKDKHIELGKGPKNRSAQLQFDRAWNLLLEIAGDVPLDGLRRAHGNEFITRLVKNNAGAETIKRYLSQVRPVITTGIQEFELKCTNHFNGLTISNQDEGPRKPRDSYSMAELDALQARCREVDDQRRWAVLMLSDTMARLAEIVGLAKADVDLNALSPHIRLRSTEMRRLKTKQSARDVPLVGLALWAAQRAMATPGPFLFPVFQPKDTSKQLNPSGASAALNKWLQENGLAREGQGLHSLRHTMRDRLREVMTPSDLIDQIGGWKTSGVGESYGKGYSLAKKQEYMLAAVRPDLTS
jgi:integrase